MSLSPSKDIFACQTFSGEALSEALHMLAGRTIAAPTLADFLADCHDVVSKFIPSKNFLIALHERERNEITFPYYADECDKPATRPYSNGLTEYVLALGKPVLIRGDGFESMGGQDYGVKGTKSKAWMGAPFFAKDGSSAGVIAVQSYDSADVFDETHLSILSQIATHVGVAIEHMRAEEALKASEARFRAMFQNAAIGIAIIGLDGSLQDINDTGLDIIGHTRESLSGASITDYTHPEDAEQSAVFFNSVITGERDSYSQVKRYLRHDGGMVWGRQTVALVRDDGGNPLFAVSMLEDVSRRKEAEAELLHRERYDRLTGLLNRREFLKQLNAAILAGQDRDDFRFSVILLDLDRFKLINESLGHGVGDEVLRHAATLLSEVVGDAGLVARQSGDEFAILLPNSGTALEAVEVCDNINRRMATPVSVVGREIYIGVSCGIVIETEEYTHGEDIIRDVDSALYRAKERGRGGYEIFERPMLHRAQTFLRVETDLRRALERDEIFVVYQPIVDALSTKPVGFEALVRWKHPERGIISPAEFIPVAEETGLIEALDKFVFRTACTTVSRWNRELGADLTLHVNLSPRNFRNKKLAVEMLNVMRENDFPGPKLSAEVTETVLMQGGEGVRSIIDQLREHNVRIVLDDFGTGYSSLSYLHRFPIDGLKVDREFISTMQPRNMSYSIVHSILTLGRNLDIEVVAEGAETSEQIALLKYIGCHLVQGYYFSRPVTEEEAEKLIGKTLPLT